MGDIEDCRRRLAEAVEQEDAAWQERNMSEAAIAEEMRRATQSEGDEAVDQFATWLKGAQARLDTAEIALAKATITTAYRRAELSLTRAAVKILHPVLGP